MQPAIYSGKNRWSSVVETEVRMTAHRVGHEDVRRLVEENASGESECEEPPVAVGARGW
jgi:hypothetical protein